MAASLVTHPNVETTVHNAVTTLTTSVANIAGSGTTTPALYLTQAIAAFDQTLLDTTGLFGPLGKHKNG